MIKLEFTEAQAKALNTERGYPLKPGQVVSSIA